jgi:hypothetical protein
VLELLRRGKIKSRGNYMNRSTIVLLIILAVLGGSYFFYFKDNEVNYSNSSSIASPSPEQDLTEIALDQIKTISWSQESNSGEIRQFESGQWEFVTPVTLKLDNDKAVSLAQSVDSLSGTPRINISELSLKDAGLENPYATIKVTSDGRDETILVGSTSIDESSRYVHRQGSDFIVLVYTYKLDMILMSPSELVPDPSPSPSI